MNATFRRRLVPSLRHPLLSLLAVLTMAAASGCNNDIEVVRQVQSQRQARERQQAQIDHLRSAMEYVSQLAQLDVDSAEQQVIKHLNTWYQTQPSGPRGAWRPTQLVDSWRDVLSPDAARQAMALDHFVPDDLWHLRLNYLVGEVADWTAESAPIDPLLEDWFTEQAAATPDQQWQSLQTASRLFDWTVRNVRLEPMQPADPAPQPAMPAGLTFRGAGYRQTTLGTLWHGSGDALQRTGLFLQLCRHMGLDACVLAVPGEAAAGGGQAAAEATAWVAAVRIGDQLYLFDAALGLPLPGPGQRGIATLAQARSDASVLRRLNVAGAFQYPYDQQDIQQCVALLEASPELLSERMYRLQSALTGQLRCSVYLDADATAQRLSSIAGISGVRLWDRSLKARLYQETLRRLVQEDPRVGLWYFDQYGMMSDGAVVPAPKPQKALVRSDAGDDPAGEPVFKVEEGKMSAGAMAGNTPWVLVNARWRHLTGQFDATDGRQGARGLYMDLRRPEYEIADLGIDVQLQQQYGIRREPGMPAETYDNLVRQFQRFARQAKQHATYWLSLIHMDQSRWDAAGNWLEDRVLDGAQPSPWESAARYNLARTLEHQGQIERASELYKTSGDPQEHGNRLRARLITQTEGDVEGEAER